MIWFTSDFHFDHTNIIEYSNRPFASVEEMNSILIDNINRDVKASDILYILGDFCFSRSHANNIIKHLNSIKCKNLYFIYGNHDKELRRLKSAHHYFVWLKDFAEIKYYNQSITLCHYAMRVWNKSHYGAWHLYGHSHGSLPDDKNSLSLDVGIDTELYNHIRFRPYSFDEIANIMLKYKTYTPVDHHV